MSALRDTDGKLDWAMLFEYFPLAFPELCKARMFGAKHYTKDGKDGRSNWRESINGTEHDKFFKGCIRGNISHNLKCLWGEDRDAPQDNVHHLAFGALNNLMALEYALAKESKGIIKDCTDLGAQGDLAVVPSRYDWSVAPVGTKYGVTMKDSVCTQLFLKELPVEISYYRNIELAPVQSRYPWKDAPEWATCGAVDSNDIGYFHELKPTVDNSDWSEWSSRGRVQEIMSEMLRDGEDWRDTLEMKP